MIVSCKRGHLHFDEFGCGQCKHKFICDACRHPIQFYANDWCMIDTLVYHRLCLHDRSYDECYDLTGLFSEIKRSWKKRIINWLSEITSSKKRYS